MKHQKYYVVFISFFIVVGIITALHSQNIVSILPYFYKDGCAQFVMWPLKPSPELLDTKEFTVLDGFNTTTPSLTEEDQWNDATKAFNTYTKKALILDKENITHQIDLEYGLEPSDPDNYTLCFYHLKEGDVTFLEDIKQIDSEKFLFISFELLLQRFLNLKYLLSDTDKKPEENVARLYLQDALDIFKKNLKNEAYAFLLYDLFVLDYAELEAKLFEAFTDIYNNKNNKTLRLSLKHERRRRLSPPTAGYS